MCRPFMVILFFFWFGQLLATQRVSQRFQGKTNLRLCLGSNLAPTNTEFVDCENRTQEHRIGVYHNRYVVSVYYFCNAGRLLLERNFTYGLRHTYIEAMRSILGGFNGCTTPHKVILLGHNDSCTIDKKMQVTVAYNCFGEGLIKRMPRCRHGYFHVVNNYYTSWEMYAIGGSANPPSTTKETYIPPDWTYPQQIRGSCGHPQHIIPMFPQNVHLGIKPGGERLSGITTSSASLRGASRLLDDR